MPLGNQALCIYNLYDSAIHFSAFQHLSSPRTILSYKRKKAQPLLDFFDTLSTVIYELPYFFTFQEIKLFAY